MWGLIAALAQIAAALVPLASARTLHVALVAVGYGLILPVLAVMHLRHGRVRESGTILATSSGTAVVALGIAASASRDLLPAAVFVTGIWWWTVGKMWWETGTTHRIVGATTMALAALCFATVPLSLRLDGEGIAGLAAGTHLVLGAWLLVVAGDLWRTHADTTR